jgi:ribokinase
MGAARMREEERDVIAIGDTQVALTFASTSQPLIYGTEVTVPNVVLTVAGSTTNFAIATSSIRLKTALISKTGGDYYGRFNAEELRRLGIDVSQLMMSPEERTSISVVIVHENGKKFVVTYLGTQGNLSFEDIEPRLAYIKRTNAKLVHVGGYFLLPRLHGEATIKILKQSRDTGALTSFDTCWDPKAWTSKHVRTVRGILKYVDVFLPNLKEAQYISGSKSYRNAAENLLNLGPKIVALKMGSSGCYVVSKDKKARVKALKVEAVNTDGAGDAFNAGIVYGIIKGLTLEDAAKLANALGALKTTRLGTHLDFETQEETVNQLRELGVNLLAKK